MGRPPLIGYCQQAGWSYRIRLKGNLTLHHEGGELTTGEVAARIPEGLTGVGLYASGVSTNIDVLHDKGYKEP